MAKKKRKNRRKQKEVIKYCKICQKPRTLFNVGEKVGFCSCCGNEVYFKLTQRRKTK